MKIRSTFRDLLHVTDDQTDKTRKTGEIVKSFAANAPKFALIDENINSKNLNCHEKDRKTGTVILHLSSLSENSLI